MGSAEGRGCLIVSGGQKGGRVWTIPEQRRWYGWGGGGEECICDIDNEGRQ